MGEIIEELRGLRSEVKAMTDEVRENNNRLEKVIEAMNDRMQVSELNGFSDDNDVAYQIAQALHDLTRGDQF